MICKVFLVHAALLLAWTCGINLAGVLVLFAISVLIWLLLNRRKKTIKHKPLVIFRG
jgi:hypothetical protein